MDTASTVILNKITRACRAGAMTPSSGEMLNELMQWSIALTHRDIEEIISDLADDGRIEVHAGKHRESRWFMIPGTGLATVRRGKARAKVRRDSPVVLKPAPVQKPVNAYDAGMVLGPPIRVVGRPDSERPMPRVWTPHVPTHSECGCSAAMAVQ